MCVPPFREDVDNVDGGMWVIKVEKRHTVSCTDLAYHTIPMYVCCNLISDKGVARTAPSSNRRTTLSINSSR